MSPISDRDRSNCSEYANTPSNHAVYERRMENLANQTSKNRQSKGQHSPQHDIQPDNTYEHLERRNLY
ncbi:MULTISPECIES: hypothetical protein [Pseudomonas syringae group]|uniref:hypothetical protein n=1 Tax=Pseudomonas syringae group TaxID=136849 RepID=UPI00106F9B67|nr:hypothetical protein [Pseudomonas viridiflava]MBD8572254.1 hypothetical protein [Pseudomonas syringae]MBD8188223.1 hypothetical protein [Pseudomonas viridiflava]MEE4081777.1 hypothetical protein [Pseudomonas viridiflava]MEE4182550.1 hypothetical protein [Pseudomonas viridiflava]MEE4233452.1 hypothetical protein [Pseudomonas viridiflava]